MRKNKKERRTAAELSLIGLAEDQSVGFLFKTQHETTGRAAQHTFDVVNNEGKKRSRTHQKNIYTHNQAEGWTHLPVQWLFIHFRAHLQFLTQGIKQ